jgi:hypothetical protein
LEQNTQQQPFEFIETVPMSRAPVAQPLTAQLECRIANLPKRPQDEPHASIRARLDDLAVAAQTAADALDGAGIDLPEGTLTQLLHELEGLNGRLDLALDHLGADTDPAQVMG